MYAGVFLDPGAAKVDQSRGQSAVEGPGGDGAFVDLGER